MQRKKIYLDYAAGTPLDSRVRKKMIELSGILFKNPSAIHEGGLLAKKALEEARKDVARILQARGSEIFFTSGGTESNNLAILGMYFYIALQKKISAPHIVISSFEHSSVLSPVLFLKKMGWSVTEVPVNQEGILDVGVLKRVLTKKTILVSILSANNEVGTVQPLKKIGDVLKEFRKKNNTSFPYFHTDASQVPRYMPLSPHAWGVDLMTLDGQKIYGPKGVGVLYKRIGVPVMPIMYGGKQEDAFRPGTPSLLNALLFAEALRICEKERKKEIEHLSMLRDLFLHKLLSSFPGTLQNGSKEDSVPGIINLFFPHIIDAERLLIDLDRNGIEVSLGSACGTHGIEPSYVLQAMFHNKERAQKSIRFSLGRETTKKDILYVIMTLKKIFKKGNPNIL